MCFRAGPGTHCAIRRVGFAGEQRGVCACASPCGLKFRRSGLAGANDRGGGRTAGSGIDAALGTLDG
jgi:hypothetical protein